MYAGGASLKCQMTLNGILVTCLIVCISLEMRLSFCCEPNRVYLQGIWLALLAPSMCLQPLTSLTLGEALAEKVPDLCVSNISKLMPFTFWVLP